MILIVLAKVAGKDHHPSAIADWLAVRAMALREALHLRRPRLPRLNTYRRILADVVSPDELETTVSAFVRNLTQTGRTG